MDKVELEKMLLDPNFHKRISEWANNYRQNVDSSKQANSQVALAPKLDFEIRPTFDEIKANHGATDRRDFFHARIGQFIPELKNKNPTESLNFLTSKYREEPTRNNMYLVIDALNRLTIIGEPGEHSKKMIQDTVKMIDSTQEKEGMADGILSVFFEHADNAGRGTATYLEPGWVYWRQPELNSSGLNDTISSLFTSATNEVGINIILFEHNNYWGRYVNFSAPSNTYQVFSYVGDFINDMTSSYLIVRRFANELSPAPLSRFVSKDQILEFISTFEGIWARGDPVLTWDLWPAGAPYHPNSPDKKFIFIRIPIRVHTPWPFADYDAEIRYWIYLYVDGSGNLQGYVEYYHAWVEPGIINGDVYNGLMEKLPGTLGKVNEFVSKATNLANTLGPFDLMYLLPGRSDSEGNVDDDVSIVLRKR